MFSRRLLKGSWIIAVGLTFALIVGFGLSVSAENSSPVGTWVTIDDETNQPKSHVKIYERNGKIYGKIIKLINPDEPNPVCDECEGNLKNQPIVGMRIMWNLSKGDDEWWEGGRILDPGNGKTYRCKIRLQSGGSKLDVRGYVGISLFGRTQTWKRLR